MEIKAGLKEITNIVSSQNVMKPTITTAAMGSVSKIETLLNQFETMMDSGNTDSIIEYLTAVLNELNVVQNEKLDARDVLTPLIGNFYVLHGNSNYWIISGNI